MDTSQLYSNWVEIDLTVIENNTHYIRESSHVQVMAVVKANAYGHGMVPVARAALKGGATWCAVARLEEALEFRQAGIDCPLLLLGYTPLERYQEAIDNHISVTVWDPVQIDQADRSAKSLSKQAHVHLKIDTGMGRLGVPVDRSLDLACYITTKKNLHFEGVFTHFARADENDQGTSDKQQELFEQAIHILGIHHLKPEWIHMANSAASLKRTSQFSNLVRAGIAVYGLHPSSQCQLPPNFQPALSWKSIISQVKVLAPGSGVSYGHKYITKGHELIGTVPVGYADGYRRIEGNSVLVGGQAVPVIGHVCMDQIMVLLDQIPQAKEGEVVTLIGKQDKTAITAEKVANTWGTINYEVTCGISARVPRIYIR